MDNMRGFMGEFTGGFTEAMQSLQQQPFYNQPLMVMVTQEALHLIK